MTSRNETDEAYLSPVKRLNVVIWAKTERVLLCFTVSFKADYRPNHYQSQCSIGTSLLRGSDRIALAHLVTGYYGLETTVLLPRDCKSCLDTLD